MYGLKRIIQIGSYTTMPNNDLICSLCGKQNFDDSTTCLIPVVSSAAVGDWFCTVTDASSGSDSNIVRQKVHNKNPLRKCLSKLFDKLQPKITQIMKCVCVYTSNSILFELHGFNNDSGNHEVFTAHLVSNFGLSGGILTRYKGGLVQGKWIIQGTADNQAFKQDVKNGVDSLYAIP